MPDLLRKIEAYKRREIAEAKVRMPFKTLERQAHDHDPPRGFIRAIDRQRVAMITSVTSTPSTRSPILLSNWRIRNCSGPTPDNGSRAPPST